MHIFWLKIMPNNLIYICFKLGYFCNRLPIRTYSTLFSFVTPNLRWPCCWPSFLAARWVTASPNTSIVCLGPDFPSLTIYSSYPLMLRFTLSCEVASHIRRTSAWAPRHRGPNSIFAPRCEPLRIPVRWPLRRSPWRAPRQQVSEITWSVLAAIKDNWSICCNGPGISTSYDKRDSVHLTNDLWGRR